MPSHWLLVRLAAHGSHPVSHSGQIVLKSYLDEKPGDKSDLNESDGQFVVPAERSINIPNITNSRLWYLITEPEYNAGSYDLYLWPEPYASAAVASPGVTENLALGRIKLTKANEKYRGIATGAGSLHASVKPDDLVFTHDVKLANSVVQFIVDEMNTNSGHSHVSRNLDNIDAGREADKNEFLRFIFGSQQEDAIRAVEWDLGHHTHKNEDWAGLFQDIYFGGGGEWDHKPVIRPVWGTFNRLGNRHAVYYYDGWSNIHFGFIAARMGLPLQNALEGAGVAQGVDNSSSSTTTTGDDPADAEAIRAGHSLGLRSNRSGSVTRQDVIDILDRHPQWIGRK